MTSSRSLPIESDLNKKNKGGDCSPPIFLRRCRLLSRGLLVRDIVVLILLGIFRRSSATADELVVAIQSARTDDSTYDTDHNLLEHDCFLLILDRIDTYLYYDNISLFS
nr:MAG TPA: hypothetical protein [Caudoviricetes sp.]